MLGCIKNERLLAAGIFPLASTVVAAPATPSHCTPDEENLFSCRIGRKTLSFCTPKTVDDLHAPAWIQYRFGRIGALELVFPAARTSPVANFRCTTASAGSWVDHTIQFSINDHFYTVHAYENRNIQESEGSILFVGPDGARRRLECADPDVYAAAGLWRFEQFELLPELKDFAE